MSHAASILEIRACAERGHRMDFRVTAPTAVPWGYWKTCRCGRWYEWPGYQKRPIRTTNLTESGELSTNS